MIRDAVAGGKQNVKTTAMLGGQTGRLSAVPESSGFLIGQAVIITSENQIVRLSDGFAVDCGDDYEVTVCDFLICEPQWSKV